MVNPLYCWTEVHLVPDAYNMIEHAHREKDAKVFLVRNKLRSVYISRWIPMTCVSVVKSFIGLHTMAFTPYGLYRFLMRKGNNQWAELQKPSVH